ncbi:plastocyanin/azurin family copper-binding protein [Haloarchaeobius amylolyticus]|uniref:plastocyanin/azurin family copper-binding protein n=1 Tax=Haloarchaeobius amylolyticus TaxID=1198296 RepID=UPI0022721FF7|nr:plastocyanin/azurin family copper-binding protein [Haloarchaeobius amylolyticus]
MTDDSTVDRRTVLRTTGVVLATAGLAGCLGSDSEGERTTAEPTEEPTDTPTDMEPSGDTGAATVEVGPEGEYVFTPGTAEPLTVSAGTTVTFVWESDTHNIVVTAQPDGADWGGHEPIENTGFEYEYTFDVPGTYEYVCEPHEALGMVGELVVEE